MIQFECPVCAQELGVKPELAGKSVKCPKCAQSVLVPAEATSPSGNAAAGAGLSDEPTCVPQDTSVPKNLVAATLPLVNVRALAPVQSSTDFLALPQQSDEMDRAGPDRVLKFLGEVGGVQPKPAGKQNHKLLWIGIAGALGAGFTVALGIILFWPTPDGVIRIESDDPGVEVVFDRTGRRSRAPTRSRFVSGPANMAS